MTCSSVIQTIKDSYLIAVIRGKSEEDGYNIAKAALIGGFKCVEITFSTPNAVRVMVRLSL